MANPTLHRLRHRLSDPREQLIQLSASGVMAFDEKLHSIGVDSLRSTGVEILQVNVGYQCNQTCNHCHVDAGPDRKEVMTKATMLKVIDVLSQNAIPTLDITGGAPEMHAHFRWLVEQASPFVDEIIVRSNLTIFSAHERFADLPEFFAKHRVRVISSLPCYTEKNTDRQRGRGVFGRSIEAIRALNRVGYARPGTGLVLDLVYNPQGITIPGNQAALEIDYKLTLKEEYDLDFDRLYCITNLPISRFLESLSQSDQLVEYMNKLLDAFNPGAVEGLMCRNTVSVAWDGRLHDCDFNQMLELTTGRDAPSHIDDFNLAQLTGREIVVHQHCYGCTAGSGSSCQGTLV